MPEDDKDVVDIAEAQRMLGVSRSKLYSLIGEHRLSPLPRPPLMKKRPRVEFLRSDILRLREEAERQVGE